MLQRPPRLRIEVAKSLSRRLAGSHRGPAGTGGGSLTRRQHRTPRPRHECHQRYVDFPAAAPYCERQRIGSGHLRSLRASRSGGFAALGRGLAHASYPAVAVVVSVHLALRALAVRARRGARPEHRAWTRPGGHGSLRRPDPGFLPLRQRWLARPHRDPGDRGSYGVFNELDDLTREQLLTLLDGVATGGDLEEGSDTWKAAELYRQGTDIETRNTQGIEPIQPLLDQVDAITDVASLHEFQQTAEFSWLTGLFFVYVYSDLEDSSVNAPYISSSFLGLPNRDYYLEDTEDNVAIRKEYVATLAEFLQYGGYDAAQAGTAAQAVYDLEKRLAEPTLTTEEQQDVALSYNPKTLDE
ncbi:MAG: hypothetical protein H0W23_07750, partial [Chloroflexia bacterium]|nr:hypothetical protein [Chloroflexia bacterium]